MLLFVLYVIALCFVFCVPVAGRCVIHNNNSIMLIMGAEIELKMCPVLKVTQHIIVLTKAFLQSAKTVTMCTAPCA